MSLSRAQLPSRTFQDDVVDWVCRCFGLKIAMDKAERNHRFLEESLELVQSLGVTKADCMELVNYVYSRPTGDPRQEIGGVMTTLYALANAYAFDAAICGEIELARCNVNIDKIRQKQLLKPKGSPLSEVVNAIQKSGEEQI